MIYFIHKKQTPTQFLWTSEQTGYLHLELHNFNTKKLIKTLTNGTWIVQRIFDVDEINSIVYFIINREASLEIHLYAINYNDEIPTIDRITQESGCHVVHCFNQTYQYYHIQQGLLQTIEQFHLVKPELCSILNRNNDTLYCTLYKPDKEQGIYQTTYPALVSIYDNRGSANRGVVFESSIKHDMGHLELDDQLDGVLHLIKQDITDEIRVGIYGWSYGG
ncbi:unnamed protein product [Rotaria sp. Silwood1]|nr:unnamed protein product [Rotaria sp. Silwood1]CAF3945356.1 unnamed protein product [Rotaria sp. Silwood1]CAF5128807.1 unnamed protein product [Rotaria sp. Silwood1]